MRAHLDKLRTQVFFGSAADDGALENPGQVELFWRSAVTSRNESAPTEKGVRHVSEPTRVDGKQADRTRRRFQSEPEHEPQQAAREVLLCSGGCCRTTDQRWLRSPAVDPGGDSASRTIRLWASVGHLCRWPCKTVAGRVTLIERSEHIDELLDEMEYQAWEHQRAPERTSWLICC